MIIGNGSIADRFLEYSQNEKFVLISIDQSNSNYTSESTIRLIQEGIELNKNKF